MALPGLTLAARPLLAAAPDADAVAVPLARGEDGPEPGPGADEVAGVLALDLPDLLAREKATGDPGEVLAVPVTDGSSLAVALLVGVGDGSPAALRRAGAALARRAAGRTRLVTSVVSGTAEAPFDGLRAFVEGLALAAYTFTRRSQPKQPGLVEQVTLVVDEPDMARETLGRAVVTAEAVHTARDLANTPSQEKTPQWLAEQAALVASRSGLAVHVRDARALRDEGFGGIVAVGQGSASPPRLVELTYTPDVAGPSTPHVVLVGKGITFDTGGLSLKPREAMVPMKTDMSGGAAVIAVMGALRASGVPVRVTGLVAAAENMPSGSAYRPGDVLTQYGGRTVEVVNTDAEGRLVLADALAYADAALDPDVVVDVATLTGAAALALGRTHAAAYSDDDALAEALVAAGEDSGERLWRMPLVADYRASLDSDVADLCHVSTDPHASGGSITAALFLREFAGARTWAHLDIAGPARAQKDSDEITKGGTGFGARVLLRWLENGL
ncbi:MAG: leucyl aminopeptidase [Actinomycetes bacterium]